MTFLAQAMLTPTRAVLFAVLLGVGLVGCGSGDTGSDAAEAEASATLADLDLGPTELTGELDSAQEAEMQAALAAEFETELGVSATEASCLSESVALSDLLEAGSAANGGDGADALERVLEGFDDCGVDRSVFENQ